MADKPIKKVVLAYSGGLDSSTIVKWLQTELGAEAVAHGSTGTGTAQVRYGVAYYALEPDIRVVAPWRQWDFKRREALLDFAEKHQIPITKDKRGEAPFSVDANLLHSSSEGKV